QPAALRLIDLAHAEVEHFDEVRRSIAGREKDVLGLEITVNNPSSVDRRKGITQLSHDVDRAPDGKALLERHREAEIDAVQALHDDVQRAILEPPHVEHIDHVRTSDSRSGFCLATKALHPGV